MNNNNLLSNRLRFLRAEKGLSQKDIAAHLNIAQKTYARYEKGIVYPSILIMGRLADFYDTSIDYLMERTNKRELLQFS